MDDPKLKTEQNNVLNNLYLDTSLGSLVEIYILMKKYADAESMIQRLMKLPMEVRKDSLRQNDLRLAWLKHAQGNSKEAEALYRELIEYYKKEFPNGRLPILTLVELNINQLNKRLPKIIDSKLGIGIDNTPFILSLFKHIKLGRLAFKLSSLISIGKTFTCDKFAHSKTIFIKSDLERHKLLDKLYKPWKLQRMLSRITALKNIVDTGLKYTSVMPLSCLDIFDSVITH
jgi:hypothetical protein